MNHLNNTTTKLISKTNMKKKELEIAITTYTVAYKKGYIKALEDNKDKKYTDEDMLTIRNQLVTMLPVGDVAAWDMIQAVSKYTKWLDEYIESLQPKTEWEVEFINGKLTIL